MKKSIQILSWFMITGAAWFLGYSYNVYNGGLISWLRAMYENKMAMAAQIQAPRRLLITGGSGAHYTVNSKLLEKKLGIPVLNLALDGNLGLNLILPLISEQVHPGDIVLLIPEYLMLLDDDGLGERSAEFGMAIGRPGLGGVPTSELVQETWLLGLPTLRGLTKSTVSLIEQGKIVEYYSDPITERGDPTRTFHRKTKWWPMPIGKSVTKHSLERIAQFRKEVEAKGGTLILSMPVVYAKTDQKTLANVRKTAEKLGKVAPLIYDPKTLNIKAEPSLFADTQYHLEPKGRVWRSLQLAKELKPFLAGKMSTMPEKLNNKPKTSLLKNEKLP